MPDLPPGLLDALHALDELKGKPWTVVPLAGGITNQNYLLRVDEKWDIAAEAFVLRIAGAGTDRLGIDREQEHACAVAAAECGAGCQVIAFLPEHQALVVRYAEGKALVVRELDEPDVLARTVATLRRFHEGPAIPGRFRVALTVAQYLKIASDGGVRVPLAMLRLAARLLPAELKPQGQEQLRPCHNDLLPANLIDDGGRVMLIDWEYAAMGDPWFDLGNLAENNRLSAAGERRLLELYFGEPRPDELLASELARLRRMRFASAMREAAWGFAQATLSTLDFGFAAYGEQHLERAQTLSGESETR